MSKEECNFKDFMQSVDPIHRDFFTEVDKLLTDKGYLPKIELKKTGYAVSYFNKNIKRTIANFVTRKKGILMRIYADNTDQYMDIFSGLPESMVKEINKAQDCKRMIDPTACNPKCKMGVTIMLENELRKKCRYSALLFLVQQEKYQHIKSILNSELNVS